MTTQTATRKHGAELVFLETLDGRHWHGRLLTHAMDRQTGKQANIRAASIHERTDGHTGYDYVMQGGHRGGRRYGYAETLADAQAALIAWARRRFYVEA